MGMNNILAAKLCQMIECDNDNLNNLKAYQPVIMVTNASVINVVMADPIKEK